MTEERLSREALIEEMDRIGFAMFGSGNKFRLGIWIASLRGSPHTFSVLEWWAFCRDAGWPGAGKPIGHWMRRFEQVGMVERVPGRKRRPLWRKLDSPAWGLFESLDPWVRYGEPRVTLSELQARIARADLEMLRKEFLDGPPVESEGTHVAVRGPGDEARPVEE